VLGEGRQRRPRGNPRERTGRPANVEMRVEQRARGAGLVGLETGAHHHEGHGKLVTPGSHARGRVVALA
jgi:hypothetical protein